MSYIKTLPLGLAISVATIGSGNALAQTITPIERQVTKKPSTITQTKDPRLRSILLADEPIEASAAAPGSFRTVLGCESQDLVTIKPDFVGFIGLSEPGARELFSTLETRLKRGEKIKAFALSPDCKGGSFVTDKSSFTRNIGKPTGQQRGYYDTLKLLEQKRKKMTAISFDPFNWRTQKGWVIAYEGGVSTSKNIDPEFKAKLQTVIDRGEDIVSIAFKPRAGKKSGWSILGSEGYAFTRNIGGSGSNSYFQTLNDLTAQGIRLSYNSFQQSTGSNPVFALGNNDCQVSNARTQRFNLDCQINMIDVTYDRKAGATYDCPYTRCSNYQTKASLMHTDTTPIPRTWYRDRDTVSLKVCDENVVAFAKHKVVVRDPSGRVIKQNRSFINGCSNQFTPTEQNERTVEGDYIVSVTLQGRPGSSEEQTQSKDTKVPIKDVWVVVMGDSYASGEGAAIFDVRTPVNETALWLHTDADTRVPYKSKDEGGRPPRLRCNVSPVSWGAEAANYIADHINTTKGYAVKISNFACSGAVIGADGFIEKSHKYPQIHALRAAVQDLGRKPDFVLFAGGGNDANFAKIIEECIKAGCEKTFGFIEGPNDKREFEKAQTGLNDLHNRYQAFADYIDSYIADDRVFTPAYFDPLRGDDGKLAVCPFTEWRLDKSLGEPIGYFVTEINNFVTGREDVANTECPAEKVEGGMIGNFVSGGVNIWSWEAANERVAKPLRLKHKDAAKTHGWNYVSAAFDAFQRNGNCSSSPRTNRICEAVRRTGDKNGAFHPNREGHKAVGLEVGKAIMDVHGDLEFFD